MAEDDRRGNEQGGGSPNDQDGRSPWRAIVGLGLIVVLVAGVLFVMQQLRHAAAIQDCVASGRRDCVPVGR